MREASYRGRVLIGLYGRRILHSVCAGLVSSLPHLRGRLVFLLPRALAGLRMVIRFNVGLEVALPSGGHAVRACGASLLSCLFCQAAPASAPPLGIEGSFCLPSCAVSIWNVTEDVTLTSSHLLFPVRQPSSSSKVRVCLCLLGVR